MRGSTRNARRDRAQRVLLASTVVIAMLVTAMASVTVVGETVDARGPEYGGPQTTSDGPAYFGPAPNPFPYCDSPTYFDPFLENIDPIGRMDVGDTASVTTNGVEMKLTITAEGNPGTQYPGFFPSGGEGGANDRAKGIELAEGDTAVVSLSAPLFYSQWIFTDVDQPDEGFTVTPAWTVPGQAAVFAGDDAWTFDGTTSSAVVLDDTDGQSHASQSINGRGQVDFLGAVTGIEMQRTFPSNGQSGFAVGGGCEAAGAAKVVVDGPTWNGSSFDVTYELRMRNNLPSSATIQSVIDDAVGAVGASLVTGTPQGISLNALQLTEDLSDDAFSSIEVTDRSTDGDLVLNPSFDGINDVNLISSGEITAEENEVITLSVRYTPDFAQAQWSECSTGYDLLNQTELTARAANVPVSDLSDNGTSASPGDDNGEGGVDDPTPVSFPCPPGSLEIVKTVVPGPNGVCPSFADGIAGDGPALPVTVDDVVTYCVSVGNPGPGPITNVIVSDAQAPGDISLPDLVAGETATATYDVTVSMSTPPLNTATATADDAAGPLAPVQDTALIEPIPKLQPVLQIVKTVVPGPNGTCPSFDDGVGGLGPALAVSDGDTVTYCISVRNIGQGDALNVIVSDDQAPGDFEIGTLASGEDDTVSYDIAVDADTTAAVNIATASYSGPDGPLDPVDDDAQIDISPLQPALEIVKTVLAGADATCPSFADGVVGIGTALAVSDGDTVTYCVSVQNTGPGIATNVVITDSQAPAPFDIGTLAAGEGETVQYNVTVDLATESVNTATATGAGPDGDLEPVSDPAQIAVDALPDPFLEIVKTALPGPDADCPEFDDGVAGLGDAVNLLEGDTVTFCITVRNSGAGAATDVQVTDEQAPDTFDLNIGDLASGESATRSYDVVVDMTTPTTNVATANGSGPNGSLDPVSDPALIAVSLQPDPILEIVKTVVPGPNGDCPATFDDGTAGDGEALDVAIGDTVTYCITVQNVGDNEATQVTVVDEQAPGVLQLGVVGVGQEVSESYDVVVDASTPAINTATVNGNGPNGPVPSDSDTAVITPGPLPTASISLIHSVSKADEDCVTVAKDLNSLVANIEELPVTWCALITNDGSVPLTNVVLEAPAIGDGDPIDVLASTEATVLLPGESIVVPVAGEIPDTGLLSAAVVEADPADADGNVLPDIASPSDTDDAEVREASIDLETTVASGADADCDDAVEVLPTVVGEDITWCFEVTNTGAVDLLVTQVSDPVLGVTAVIPPELQRLAPNVTIVVSSNDVSEGPVEIDADVRGKPLDSDGTILDQAPEVEDIDPAQIVIAAADLALVKTNSNPGPVGIGEIITYTLTITNNGPDTASGVQVVDELPAGISYVTLPGDSDWACSLDDDEAGFGCLKATDMENGVSVALTYTARINNFAPADTVLTNVAEVTSETPDDDPTNNDDSSTTETVAPDEVVPRTIIPEYPGPFNPPETAPPAAPVNPDEVLGLAITGASSNLLGLVSAAMLAFGGLLTVGARRSREDG